MSAKALDYSLISRAKKDVIKERTLHYLFSNQIAFKSDLENGNMEICRQAD